MICKTCNEGQHKECKKANKNKTPSSCDCQHRKKK